MVFGEEVRVRKHRFSRQRGFSLAELMVIISIMGVLMSIALPLLIAWYRNASLQSAGRDLYSSLKLAQANAARRNQNCAVTFGGGGYTVYVDANRNFTQDAGEIVLGGHRWNTYSSVSVALADITFASNPPALPTVAFSPSSLPVAPGGARPNGGVTLRSTTGRSMVVTSSISGNIRIRRN